MKNILDEIVSKMVDIKKYRRKPYMIIFNVRGFKDFILEVEQIEKQTDEDFKFRGIPFVVCNCNERVQVVCHPIEYLSLNKNNK